MSPPDRPTRRGAALTLLCTANFMVILDSQIVILALPSIEQDLSLTPVGTQWVLSAYLLSFGGLLLLGGRVADLLGGRRVFLIGTTLFLLTSLACGFAPTGGLLIAARVLQGVSAAMMAPSALAILMTTFPEGAGRTRALAVWSGVGGFGGTTALLVGGGVTGWLGWAWIFFLNVPVAGLLLTLGPGVLAESRGSGRGYDPAGALTITAALALAVYAVVQAPEAGWTSLRTLGLLAGTAVLLAVFVAIERRSAAPLIPLRLFRSRALTGGNLVMLLAAMCAFGLSFTVSVYAQEVLGYSPLLFGVSTAVLPLGAVVGAYAAQALITPWGYRIVAVTGMVLLGSGALLLSQASPGGTFFGELFPGLLVFGLGLGGSAVAGPVAALSGVRTEDSGLASGVTTAAFQVGGALGVAIVSTVAASRPLLDGISAGFTVVGGFAVLGLAVATILLGRERAVDFPRTAARSNADH
ncbi:MFS transporter [Amycolatopsis sp. H20-H5]|uniref:MFS transporter n=1 Tax=Amycolatopsis sp. H20-H5 TaxID=3046309 RepID=UPI002DBB00DC|nr:MFS transporter [Amycolatopsis sp. H20-H5]MEC3978594.1 MFS transporter [Amycolatopsis sp. H20-H5]